MANYKKSFNFRSGVQVDTDNFVINSNGLVGIGTSIPRRVLDVYGSGGSYGTIRTSGLVTSQHIYNTGISTFESDVNVSSGTLKVGDNIKLGVASGIITATAINIGSRTVTELVGYATDAWVIHPSISGISTTYNVGIGTTLPKENYELLVGSDPNSANEGVSISRGNLNASGIITATSFSGITTADSLVGTIDTQRLPTTVTTNIIQATERFEGPLVGIATTARGLIGTPDIDVNIATASSVDAQTATIGFATISNTLYSHRVGIGTSLPSADLEIRRNSGDVNLDIFAPNGASRISIGQSVGVGNSSAAFRFNGRNLEIYNYDIGNIDQYLHDGGLYGPGIDTGKFRWIYGQGNSVRMELTYTGNLGINQENPTSRLHVNGTATITGNTDIANLNVTGTTTLKETTLNDPVSVASTISYTDITNGQEFVVPVVTTEQQNGMTTSTGSIIFNSEDLKFRGYTGIGWSDFNQNV